MAVRSTTGHAIISSGHERSPQPKMRIAIALQRGNAQALIMRARRDRQLDGREYRQPRWWRSQQFVSLEEPALMLASADAAL